jgi:predicted RNA-binding protein with PUA-like domain
MAYWIVKTEPTSYSFDRLLKDRQTTWDGVRNPQALKYIGSMAPGDVVLIYHTGAEKRIVGLGEVVSKPVPDPKQHDPRVLVVDLRAQRPVKRPVLLAEIKKQPELASLRLVRQARLSVIPVDAGQWKTLMRMADES